MRKIAMMVFLFLMTGCQRALGYGADRYCADDGYRLSGDLCYSPVFLILPLLIAVVFNGWLIARFIGFMRTVEAKLTSIDRHLDKIDRD
jgi:hypothetical protein